MLIIVESPAKAKTISKIVGSKHQVKASVGHIRSISSEKKTKDGRRLEISGIDIEEDFKPIFVLDEGKKKVVSELKTLAKDAKDGILFATDEDREGEAISWHLAEVLKLDPKKIQRLVFHE
ncbi:MAG: toprim domain-containing protein, partial [Flammeovirgaceae bacterium]